MKEKNRKCRLCDWGGEEMGTCVGGRYKLGLEGMLAGGGRDISRGRGERGMDEKIG